MKEIGPSFYDEILSAGLAGLPFSWSADGTITFSETMTPAQIDGVNAVYAAHNPDKPSWDSHQEAARAALEDSDVTVIRCVENGVGVPAEWAAYRRALRAIVGASAGDATQLLPVKPAYPAGT